MSRSKPASLVRLLALFLAGAIALAACFSAGAVAAPGQSGAIASDSAAVDSNAALVSQTTTSIFDTSAVHEIAIEVDPEDYETAIATYIASGDKDWIEATVTIDGVTYQQVGIRLKGNSSLRGVSADDGAETLPWLIRLDKYVDDQNHDGYVDLVVRSNSSASSLNEAVALDLLDAAGLATQQATFVGLSVNGSDAVLRLVIEHPDDVWMSATIDADGALYKAESTGDYSYRGDDPDSYDNVFDQEAGKDNADLTPLMEFLDFINNADDASFESELAAHLDVESFADYLAMMDLVDNFDDIDGPGNNSYLYYDTETGSFTVVPWDLNLAFGAMPNGGGGAGGDMLGGPAGAVDGQGAFDDAGTRPEPPARDGSERVDGFAGGGGPGGSNILVERFMETDAFEQLYQQALSDLQSELFESGTAEDLLADRVAVLATADGLIDTATLDTEAAALNAAI